MAFLLGIPWISSPDLDSPQKINLEWYLFLNGSLQITVTNLFLLLQNYLRPFQTWRHPSSPNHCKPLSQSECMHNIKSCHLLDKKGTHSMRMYDNNTTCNRSNQNASLPDTHSYSTNQHPAAPDTTKTTCYRSAAQCWKAFLVISSIGKFVSWYRNWWSVQPSRMPNQVAKGQRSSFNDMRSRGKAWGVHVWQILLCIEYMSLCVCVLRCQVEQSAVYREVTADSGALRSHRRGVVHEQ